MDVKQRSESLILKLGGKVCDWLPVMGDTVVRDLPAVVSRALILNAMVNIHFGAPTAVIGTWLEQQRLTPHLSPVERGILSRSERDLTEQESVNLYWYLEALWACMWATRIVPSMEVTQSIPDHMAALCPDLRRNEGSEKFRTKMKLRDYPELYQERDLYYRAMWWARQSAMTGQADPRFEMSRIMERRRALSWIMDAGLHWDDVPQDT